MEANQSGEVAWAASNWVMICSSERLRDASAASTLAQELPLDLRVRPMLTYRGSMRHRAQLVLQQLSPAALPRLDALGQAHLQHHKEEVVSSSMSNVSSRERAYLIALLQLHAL